MRSRRFLGRLQYAVCVLYMTGARGRCDYSVLLYMNKMQQSYVSISFQAMELVRDSPVLNHLCSMPLLHPPFYLVQQFFHWLFMGYPLVPFCLFTWDKWLKVTCKYYLARYGIKICTYTNLAARHRCIQMERNKYSNCSSVVEMYTDVAQIRWAVH